MSQNDLQPKSGNPAFNSRFLDDVIDIPNPHVMSISGTVNKTAVCLLLVMLAAFFSWNVSAQGFLDMAQMLAVISFIVSFVLAFVIIFMYKFPAIKFMVPLYALAEGVFLGSISFLFEKIYPGIVNLALESTFLCIALMLVLYKFGVIRVTEKLRSVILLSTLTISGIYLIDFTLSFFGIRVPIINSVSNFGIVFSVGVVIVAAFNLLLDFDFIETAAQRFFPKHIEWYCAFGLMVTIVWLYLAILRFLAKLQRRN